jgi:UDP-glucose 4-epimerase
MTLLVTGGAGYVGCHVVRALGAAGVNLVALDDLSTGDPERLPRDVAIEVGSTLDIDTLERVFSSYQVAGVVHLAAKKRVDESVAEPSRYFKENVEGLRVLLDQCARSGVRHFLFSSSGAVYGVSDAAAVDENSPCFPANPYGQTKLAGEWLVHSVGAATGMRTMALRYFNVAGAGVPELGDVEGDNLIPRALRAIRDGRPPVIFGTDYATPDGTCVRDYVHVVDVADAHVAAVQALERGEVKATTLNIGTGRGESVRSVIDAALAATGSDLEAIAAPRRPGDVPSVVAVADAARSQLHWSASHTLTDMISSSWDAMAVSS